MIELVFGCTYNTVYLLLIVFLSKSFFERRHINISVKDAIIYSLLIIIYNLSTMCFERVLLLKLILSYLLYIVGLKYIYKSKYIKIVLILGLMFGIGLGSDYLMFNMQKLFFPKINNLDVVYSDSSTVYMGTLSLLLQLIIVLIIKRFASDARYDVFNSTETIKYSVFPVFSVIIVAMLCLQSENNTDKPQIVLSIICISLILMMNVYVFFFLRNEIEHKNINYQHLLIEKHAIELAEMYNQSCKDRELQAKKTHEFKNVLSATEKLLADGKIDEAHDYVKSQMKESVHAANIVNTGNAIVNAIFNTKYAEAINKNIIMRFNLCDLSSVKLDYSDMVIILSNLFNNAIEACEKCEPNKRTIDVVIKTLNNFELMISVKNTYKDLSINESDNYITTKFDKNNHGFGLNNIENVISKLNGYFDVHNDEQFFYAFVVVNCN